MARLKTQYNSEIKSALVQQFSYGNIMQVPHIEKVVLNMGVGEGSTNASLLDSAVSELTAITGQRAVVTRAKKSIANFKIREGDPVGIRVTLRSGKMYDFLDRFIYIIGGISK